MNELQLGLIRFLGYKCLENCSYICSDQKQMQEHCEKEHPGGCGYEQRWYKDMTYEPGECNHV